MIALLEAIWASSRNERCSSAIAASITAVSAGTSDRTATRPVSVVAVVSEPPSGNATEANLGPGPAACSLEIAVARRRRGHEIVEKLLRHARDRIDRSCADLDVRMRRLLHAADLADVLQGGCTDLVGRRGGSKL